MASFLEGEIVHCPWRTKLSSTCFRFHSFSIGAAIYNQQGNVLRNVFFKKILILLETFSECKDKWDNIGKHTELLWRKAVDKTGWTLNIFYNELWHECRICHNTGACWIYFLFLPFKIQCIHRF